MTGHCLLLEASLVSVLGSKWCKIEELRRESRNAAAFPGSFPDRLLRKNDDDADDIQDEVRCISGRGVTNTIRCCTNGRRNAILFNFIR